MEDSMLTSSKVPKHCENKLEIVVDKDFWALKKLELKYEHTLRRNSSQLKERLKGFLMGVLLVQFKTVWRVYSSL